MSDFHGSFEEGFRGSRDTITKRLRQYEPFIRPVVQAKLGKCAIDLGCGRGEWLRVLSELGQGATGVDLDIDMLQAAPESGLDVQIVDALQYLRQQPDECSPIISAFHLVEHLPFTSMQDLVREAYRCLIPGGLIILETPNPENLTASAANFFLDRTLSKPIPPLQLSFVVENAGFSPVKVIRLQEEAKFVNRPDVSLMDVLGGASPDYAIVAQKTGNEELSIALSGAFDRAFGLELSTLANRSDETMTGSIRGVGSISDQRFRPSDDEIRATSKSTDEMKQSIALRKTEIEHPNARPVWRVFGRTTGAPKALGRHEEVKETDRARRPSRPNLVKLNQRLRRVVAMLFKEETKEAYQLLLETVSPSAAEALGRRESELSPRAAYFNDRLLAGPKGRKDL